MAKKLYEESNIQAIADAIREKNGETTTYKPSEMAAAITAITTGGGDIEVEPIELSGNQAYGCSRAIASNYIKLFGNTITTKDLSSTYNMFDNSTLENIPFDLNYIINTTAQIQQTFYYCRKLKYLPKMINTNPQQMNQLFAYCENLIEVPDDYFDTWNFNNSYMMNGTNGYVGRADSIFRNCYCLRKAPFKWIKNTNPKANYSYSAYNSLTNSCYVLDEIVDLPIPYINVVYTSNCFGGIVENCHRLKNFIFETNEDSSPIVVQWKTQTLNLSVNTGYVQFGYPERMKNAGIYDKQVKDDVTYQALKDDPDYWTFEVAYSRYNHDSAVATINSLPDASAYLATAGGTNTIKFRGAAGSATDGGAINTLTEEEIAVAAAKGWTVSFV